MTKQEKYDKIIDALEELMKSRDVQSITVSDIAQAAGMGKGSIYYYFPSKDAILEALITRSYEKPLETAKTLAKQTHISPLTRMAMLFQACRNSSSEFLLHKNTAGWGNVHEKALIHQKYFNHLIAVLKPELTEIIRQGVEAGQVHFDRPAALAEIVLIVLATKMDNTLAPSTPEETQDTILGLISLLEKGSGNPKGSLNFMIGNQLPEDRES